MEKNLTPMLVVAAAISRKDGKMLLHKRPTGRENAGLWEFPGGKVEAGESPPEALCREIAEECGITIQPEGFEPQGFAAGKNTGQEREIVLLLFNASFPGGEIAAHEGGEFAWCSLEEARALSLGPLDRALVERLRR